MFSSVRRTNAFSKLLYQQHPEVKGKMNEFYAVSDPALEIFIEDQMYDNIEHVAKIIETWPG